MRQSVQIDFSTYIADRTRDFTGREWVFAEIDQWLADPDGPRYFIITGEPGSGKSVLAARLVQMSRNEVPADNYPRLREGSLTFVHFCQALDDRTLDPLRFVEALSRRLADRYQPFALALTQLSDQEISINATQTVGTAERGSEIRNVVIESLHIGNLSARVAFDRVVRRPLEQLRNGGFNETIIILVDALDEALTYDPDDNIVTLLGYAADLPSQARLLLTSRPDPRVVNIVGEASLDLVDDAPDDIDDVWVYAYRWLHALAEPRREELTDRVATAGKGNFLYARYVLDDLPPDVGQMEDLSSLPLPKGLDGIYRQFLKRELGRNLERWAERYRPLLGALAVARGQGLTRTQLAGVTRRPLSETDGILRACAQYLAGPQPDGPFRIYHQSFRDFLLVNEEYQVYPAEANQAIASFFLEEYEGRWLDCEDDYALRYTPTHLGETVRGTDRRRARQRLMDALITLLTDLGFLEAKTGRLGVDTFLADLHAALQLLTSESESRHQLQVLLRVLDRESHNLRGWDREQQPVFFAQQVHNRAVDMGLTHLVADAATRLVELREPHLTLVWRVEPESPALERTFTGHKTVVTAVTVTPDGRRAISASADHTLKVWNLQTGQEVCTLVGHEDWVFALAVTPDGRRAISASADQTLKIWDLETCREVRTLDGHVDIVSAVAVTPDGRHAISASWDCTLKVWDLQTGREVGTLTGHKGWVNAVAITPDGCHAISASNDQTLKVWDIQTGQEVGTFSGHESPVLTVVVIPDTRRVISISRDCILKVWDLQTCQEVHTLRGPKSWVTAVAITPKGLVYVAAVAFTSDGRRAISASDDRTLKAWDLQTRQEVCTLASRIDSLYHVAITHDGRRAISASWDCTLRVWDLQTDHEVHHPVGHEHLVNAVVVTPDGHRAISASNDRTLKIWDLQSGQIVHTLRGHEDSVRAVTVTADGCRAISASDDCTLKIWDLEAEQLVCTLVGHADSVRAVAITPDGGRAISASQDRTLKIWDLQTYQEIRTLGDYNEVDSSATGVPEPQAGSLSDDTTSPQGAQIVAIRKGANAVAITPDSYCAISAWQDNTIKFWDLETGQTVRTLTGHKDAVNAVTMLPHGCCAITASSDHTLQVWDLQTGQTTRTLVGHKDRVRDVDVTPDGCRVISVSQDRTLKVWDLQAAQVLATATTDDQLWCVAVALDGVTILAGDMVGNVYCLRYVDPNGS